MIIIKNIILYFIQIRHTDDFPSTGRPYTASLDSKLNMLAAILDYGDRIAKPT